MDSTELQPIPTSPVDSPDAAPAAHSMVISRSTGPSQRPPKETLWKFLTAPPQPFSGNEPRDRKS